MIVRRRPLDLLPPEVLIKTGEVDHADWNYRPIVGSIIRMRCEQAASLIAEHRFRRLLEVGYGSGIFLPELAHHCDELYGIDVHRFSDNVGVILERFGVKAELATGDAAAMPYDDHSFDCIVALSVLEFVEDLDAACREFHRILTPGGRFIAVTPGFSPMADLGLRILTGKSARADYSGRRQRVIPTLLKYFDVLRRITVPRFASLFVNLYTVLELSPRLLS
jgi:ubiquinone/menaquinone biosynthesis C-methylase UbiE